MFVLGMAFVFIGISLLAPDDSKGWYHVDFHVLLPKYT
jgi:hypothetical protein